MVEPVVDVVGFSHVCVGVSDIERSLSFYRETLGLEPVFDVTLDGEALETVTGDPGARGRMVGLRVPGSGVIVELLCSAHPGTTRRRSSKLGYTNISLSVADLDVARTALDDAGLSPGPIATFDRVRMLFVVDPDGTPMEIVEYPDGSTSNLEHQLRE